MVSGRTRGIGDKPINMYILLIAISCRVIMSVWCDVSVSRVSDGSFIKYGFDSTRERS